MTTPVTGAQHVPAQRSGGSPVFDNGRTRVRRLVDDEHGPVVRKEALGSRALERIAHETSILDRLSGVSGVPRALPGADPRQLVMPDGGGESLAELLERRRLAPDEVVGLAAGLSAVLAAVHAAGVVHHDLHPWNVTVTADGDVQLIDFDLATTFAQVRPAFTHHSEILGRLPYLSPEQTGRTGSAVDHRSDLYGLGAVLYEAATGHPPFADKDPLELVREILTREPSPLSFVAPELPAALSDIVALLLEKEPDRRYQSAAGVAHDLARLAADPESTFPLRERDFPLRLTAPTRLVGRSAEAAVLASALDAVSASSRRRGGPRPNRAVLISGTPGVGKSVLVNLLRPLVTDRGGWFVAGKSDQVVRDSSAGLLDALRGIARLLLAEPPQALAAQARTIAQRLGSNAAVLASLGPEFARLLGDHVTQEAVAGVAGLEERELEERTGRAVVDLLRAVASPTRPVVLFLDDLQWAPASALGILDALIDDPTLSGLLLVGAYRDAEVDPSHRLAAMTAAWERRAAGPVTIRLGPLAPEDLAALLAQVLRLSGERAQELADAVGERTGGNPFDSIELLNALREDGVLALGPDGWTWDDAAIRRHVGDGDVVALLQARIAAVGPEPAELVGIAACLGGEVGIEDLAVAAGLDGPQTAQRLAPALEAGLMIPVHGTAGEGGTGGHRDAALLDQVRFRHDRVQEAAFAALGEDGRRALQAAMGRRLARAGRRLVAARLLLASGTSPQDADEARLFVAVHREAADNERRRSDHASMAAFLGAAAQILRGATDPRDRAELATVLTEHHAALTQLGRFEEGDAVHAEATALVEDPVELGRITTTQISALMGRSQIGEALELGLGMLARLGLPFPGQDAAAVVAHELARTVEWAAGLAPADDPTRPAVTDPVALAQAAVMGRLSTPAFFASPLVSAWLVVQAHRLWEEHGPNPDLVHALGHGEIAMVGTLGEYRAGVTLLQHVTAVGQARGWDLAVAYAHFLHAVSGVHWVAPLEDGVAVARLARDACVHAGDVMQSSWAYVTLVLLTEESAAVLDDTHAEVAAALAVADRTGNLPVLQVMTIVRQFAQALQGRTSGPTSLDGPGFDTQTIAPLAEAIPIIGAYLHLFQAVLAAVAGDDDLLRHHAPRAFEKVGYLPALLQTLLVHVPYGLAAALRVRENRPGRPGADQASHDEALATLDTTIAWLAEREGECADNVVHLRRHLEGERAWALGDPDAAARCFDEALAHLHDRSRPWQHALIARRAAQLHTECGRHHLARLHLGELRGVLMDWGATALVAELDREHPVLRRLAATRSASSSASTAVSSRTMLSAASIDTTAILRVAQALASLTTTDQLQAAIGDQLRTITGATAVRLVLVDDAGAASLRPETAGAAALALDHPAAAALVPVGVVRYVMRTLEPLAVDDATADDRFAKDPYLAGRERLAVLAVPVLRSGGLRAVLVLENRLVVGAFTTDRLDFVTMLTGQLAVALDNAQLYDSLEQRIAERTEALRSANAQLETLSTTDALTGVANRRRFDVALDAEWQGCVEKGTSMAVVMVDVDHFKKYNDGLGHQAGDACLVRVGRLLASALRDSDLLCRYGGEEFAVILPRADLAGAKLAAERMRAAVEAAQLEHVPDVGVVTVSVGVGAADGASTAAGLVAAADAALYEAKRSGRNCVRP